MKFGIFGGAKISTQMSVGMAGDSMGLQAYIDYVQAAENAGLDYVFTVEHHFTGVEQVSSSLGLLTYLAAKTSRIRLGTAVVVLPWHNPALLAEQVGTLDILSGGRFDFGVGKGYRSEEFRGFAIDIAEAQERFDETLGFLRRAWSEPGRFDHRGKYWQYNDVVIEPSPLQRPSPPIWMGAGSPASIRRAAGERVNLLLDQFADIATIAGRVAIYRDECEKLGLSFDPHRIAVTRGFRVVANEAEQEAAVIDHANALDRSGALKLGGAPGEAGRQAYINSDAWLIGTPAQLRKRIAEMRDHGISTILFADVSGSKEALKIFSEEVLPEFRDVDECGMVDAA